MDTLQQIKDLYAHMKWADLQVWAAIEKTPAALEDNGVRERLFHIHYTQRLFLNVWKGGEVVYKKASDYPNLNDVKQIVVDYYNELPAYIESLSEEDLDNTMVMPWTPFFERRLGQKAVDTTLRETLFQIANHGLHHRAQLNLQIREHGGEPPMIDYIIWLWRGRPGVVLNS